MKRRITASSLLVLTLLLSLIGGLTTATLTPQHVSAQETTSNAASGLSLIEIDGDEVVYDATNGLYWYPYLTNMINMTRAQQQDYIDQLNADAYGSMTDWHFANYYQLMGLRWSLAGMATNFTAYEFPITPPGTPRTISSPFLAWPIHPDQFFTPTAVINISFFGGVWETMPIQVFNGRTSDGWGYRNDESIGGGVVWAQGEADDHFMVHSLMTPEDPNATMMFNYDMHYLPDNATSSVAFGRTLGDVGAWVVSETGPVLTPEAGGLSAGAIAGIAVGACAGAVLIFFTVRKWVWKS